jgi:chromosome segregation ATPase
MRELIEQFRTRLYQWLCGRPIENLAARINTIESRTSGFAQELNRLSARADELQDRQLKMPAQIQKRIETRLQKRALAAANGRKELRDLDLLGGDVDRLTETVQFHEQLMERMYRKLYDQPPDKTIEHVVPRSSAKPPAVAGRSRK